MYRLRQVQLCRRAGHSELRARGQSRPMELDEEMLQYPRHKDAHLTRGRDSRILADMIICFSSMYNHAFRISAEPQRGKQCPLVRGEG
jgi:hypothetical protein